MIEFDVGLNEFGAELEHGKDGPELTGNWIIPPQCSNSEKGDNSGADDKPSELYSGFTTKISPFYNDVFIDVKRGVRQGDKIFPKLFSFTLENVMRESAVR
ncbi:unnamed protein product [Heligmosomoides polygyrus]|uniref:Reverse transcriptase domain-containing protein n=1 Tax=Heligmosomoides polygyrus TaxID=6339 RepID=A0A183FWM1_HELPZ|nr:unnamed protein product [Heligmosomoides polygyrus]